MPTIDIDLQSQLSDMEENTVSDAFGGTKVTPTPSFSVAKLRDWLLKSCKDSPDSDTSCIINKLDEKLKDKELKYIIGAAIRFSYLIELTNLKITSTKMKTRFCVGKIIKVRDGGYINYQADFTPENDQRASSFTDCHKIFLKSLELLYSSDLHLDAMKKLSYSSVRNIPYESVFTYEDSSKKTVHTPSNVRLASLEDLQWLIKARPEMYSVISGANKDKIRTKTYLSDRSQTGKDQTNRAKRWEIISDDFQHASLEGCWGVERKLLTDLCHFSQFPEDEKNRMEELDLINGDDKSLCPITLLPLSFEDFQEVSEHGESRFQVGHLDPLKAQGKHIGSNVAWISADGNRIQGSLSLQDTIKMLEDIHDRRSKLPK